MVLYVLLQGNFPFNGEKADDLRNDIETKDIAQEITRGQEWKFASKDLKDFLVRGLEKDPEKRASLEELMAHAWI